MHITFATDGFRVAQLHGDHPDGSRNIPFSFRKRVALMLIFPKRARRQYRAGPGAKILGREILSCDLL